MISSLCLNCAKVAFYQEHIVIVVSERAHLIHSNFDRATERSTFYSSTFDQICRNNGKVH